MVATEVVKSIEKFIEKMGYKNNEHVLGVYLYGSQISGYAHKKSDIDINVVFDNFDLEHLIRAEQYVNGYRIEYFEKPLKDLYDRVDFDFLHQSNALLSIIGSAQIIFDKTGDLKKLQNYTIEKFSKPVPPIEREDAREMVSILNNRMEKLKKAAEENSPHFVHLYHLSVEKIRKFYHKANGIPEIQTAKVYRTYIDDEYRKSFHKEVMPDKKFIDLYIKCITDNSDNKTKLELITQLFNYATKNIKLEKNYRIKIKTRNK